MAAAPQPETFLHIVRTPGICGGEPRVDGTRVPVRCIVIEYQLTGDVAQVHSAYPGIDIPTIEEALAYYDVNREEIAHYIEDNERFAYSTD
jgi:uncharacterized protein (DUF433 family)